MAVLTEFPNLRNLLKLEQATEASYPELTLIMESVDEAIKAYLGREIEFGPYTERVHILCPTRLVFLKGLPVDSVESVTIRSALAAQTLTTSEYEVSSFGLVIYRFLHNGYVEATYTGGPLEPPGSWLRAAELQVRHEWDVRTHPGSELVVTDGGTVRRPGAELLPEVKRLLRPDVQVNNLSAN